MGKRFTEEGFCVYDGFFWHLALPQVILAVHIAIVAALFGWALRRDHLRPAAPLLVFAAGWLAWTIFEYVFHRWLLHHVRRPLLRKVFWEALHREHHRYRHMNDPDHHGVHVLITVPPVLAVAAALALASTSWWPLALYSGFLLGYCEYEALHWLFHTEQLLPRARTWQPIAALHDAHTVHHLESASRNFGFVTTRWDHAFGTWRPRRVTGDGAPTRGHRASR